MRLLSWVPLVSHCLAVGAAFLIAPESTAERFRYELGPFSSVVGSVDRAAVGIPDAALPAQFSQASGWFVLDGFFVAGRPIRVVEFDVSHRLFDCPEGSPSCVTGDPRLSLRVALDASQPSDLDLQEAEFGRFKATGAIPVIVSIGSETLRATLEFGDFEFEDGLPSFITVSPSISSGFGQLAGIFRFPAPAGAFQALRGLLIAFSRDRDEDRVRDLSDNCEVVPNRDQDDSDLDRVGDACDLCPGFDDRVDGDRDGVPSNCDNCPFVSNSGQGDADGDGTGDACECGDATGDGFVNTADARLIQQCAASRSRCPDLCDTTGEGFCGTPDARIIQLFSIGRMRKEELRCPARTPDTLRVEASFPTTQVEAPGEGGEPAVVVARLTIRNETNRPMEFVFADSQSFEIEVIDGEGNVRSRWSRGVGFLTAVMHLTLDAADEWRFGGGVKLSDIDGTPLPPGDYLLRIRLVGELRVGQPFPASTNAFPLSATSPLQVLEAVAME